MAGVPRPEPDESQQEPDSGLREPRLALIWLTAVVLCVAWIVFTRPPRKPELPPWEEVQQVVPEAIATGALVQPLVEAPKPAAAAEPTQTADTAVVAPDGNPAAPAAPVVVPAGVGFGPGLGSRVTPEADDKAAPQTDSKAAPAPETK
ncbi:MAG: hypothetical protein HZB16_11535 [Armatimonadetes bacterium]|nr:hypothetical protein [Armatimonadota bacterium]